MFSKCRPRWQKNSRVVAVHFSVCFFKDFTCLMGKHERGSRRLCEEDDKRLAFFLFDVVKSGWHHFRGPFNSSSLVCFYFSKTSFYEAALEKLQTFVLPFKRTTEAICVTFTQTLCFFHYIFIKLSISPLFLGRFLGTSAILQDLQTYLAGANLQAKLTKLLNSKLHNFRTCSSFLNVSLLQENFDEVEHHY